MVLDARSRRFRHLAVVAMVVGAVMIAGCSSSGDDATTPPAPSGGTTATPDAASPGSTPAAAFTLTSGAFADGGAIPVRHACVNQGGENASPPLAWSGVPEGTATLVLVVHDPDAALPGGFIHLVTTIPVDRSEVDDGASLTGEGPMARWIGPCPPSGEHHYVFTLYAFGPDVSIPADPGKDAIDERSSEAIGVAELTGLFAHQG